MAASHAAQPLSALLAGGTLALGIIGAFALPMLSYQNPYYGSGDLSLMNSFRAIGEDDGFAAWPFVVSAIALACAFLGVYAHFNRSDQGKLLIVVGAGVALALPIYLWNELNKIASELEADGTLADLGSGMIVFSGCMLVAIVLGLFGSQLDAALRDR